MGALFLYVLCTGLKNTRISEVEVEIVLTMSAVAITGSEAPKNKGMV